MKTINSSKQKRERQKECALCSKTVAVAYRIRQEPKKEWFFVCKTCCESSAQSPGYHYGGTWKGHKR